MSTGSESTSTFNDNCEGKLNLIEAPLCDFSLSNFDINLEKSAGQVNPVRRSSNWPIFTDFYHYNKARIRNKRDSSTLLQKYISDCFCLRSKTWKTLELEEILNTVQSVWENPDNTQSNILKNHLATQSLNTMNKKASSYSYDIPSPILLRRRLSAPETIMRKHKLAQQRSHSQESDVSSQKSEANSYPLDPGLGGGSYPNLSKKRDDVRKSTLMRRLWSHNRLSTGSRLSGSFYEWQHSFGKLISSKSSASSLHSTPDDIFRSNSRKTSPQHKQSINSSVKSLPKIELSPKRKISVYNRNYPKAEILPEDNNNDSRESINNNSLQNGSTSMSGILDTSTQTPKSEITNLNVISNVKLSESTLDLIFNHVMQDVQNFAHPPQSLQHHSISSSNTQSNSFNNTLNTASSTPQNSSVYSVTISQSNSSTNFNPLSDSSKGINSTLTTINNNSSTSSNVPSFFLNQQPVNSVPTPEHSKIIKYMISNIGTGSPYTKPTQEPQVVPRYSALPRTTSMEVNMSSGCDSDDLEIESDTMSLVDSLEDPQSPRNDSLLPDNSRSRKVKAKERKPASFFIPIEKDNETKSTALTDLLPDKLREKLANRQQKREERLLNVKQDFSPGLSRKNLSGNKKTKPILPKLEGMKRGSPISANKKVDLDPKKQIKKRLIENTPGKSSAKSTADFKSSNEPKECKKEKGIIYSSKTIRNEYYYDMNPRKVYSSSIDNINKRIEILEIMECIEPDTTPSSNPSSAKSSSKIPVLKRNDKPKTTNATMDEKSINKPTFLDFNSAPIVEDPKLDQLIANILIDTLNNPELDSSKNNNASKINKFEAIPEETSLGDNLTTNSNNVNNNNNDSLTDDITAFKSGKTAVAVVRDQNKSIPKGWITFYMMHKKDGSSDSLSDEGKLVKRYKRTKSKDKRILPPINNKSNNGKWSLIINGNSENEDLEMKLKFDDSNKTPDSGVSEDSLDQKANILPKLRPLKNNGALLYNSSNLNKMPQDYFQPKQTRTSTRRYYLSRPRNAFLNDYK